MLALCFWRERLWFILHISSGTNRLPSTATFCFRFFIQRLFSSCSLPMEEDPLLPAATMMSWDGQQDFGNRLGEKSISYHQCSTALSFHPRILLPFLLLKACCYPRQKSFYFSSMFLCHFVLLSQLMEAKGTKYPSAEMEKTLLLAQETKSMSGLFKCLGRCSACVTWTHPFPPNARVDVTDDFSLLLRCGWTRWVSSLSHYMHLACIWVTWKYLCEIQRVAGMWGSRSEVRITLLWF